MPELQRTPYRFSTEEYEQRLRKTRSSMEKLGLDLLNSYDNGLQCLLASS